MVVWHNTELQCGKNGRGLLRAVYCLLGPKILVTPLISEYYSEPDPFARARYLEKLKLLGLNDSGDPCDMENGSNLGENMT